MAATTPKPRYAIYTRISKDPDGTSTAPERQERECRRLAKERGFEVLDVYVDSDLSAYRDVVRPDYERMLSAMAAGAYDGVLVWKLDRLVRRVVEFSRFWKVASESGVALVSKNDTIDTTNPIGLAIVYMLVGMAEQESRNTSVRMRAKEREMAENGRHKGAGRRAYGMTPDWSAVVPTEAAVIRECAERALAGETLGSILRDLNAREIPSATGGRWSRQGLHKLLGSARLFGWREHLGELVAPGDWPVILDETTGRKLWELLNTPTAVPAPPSPRNLCSGLLRCGKCGARMRAGASGAVNGKPTVPRYKCPSKLDGGCNGTTIDLVRTDEVVTAMALEMLATPRLSGAVRSRRAQRPTDDTDALRELARLSDRGKELAAMWAAGELSRPAYAAAQRELDNRMAALQERLAETRRAEPMRLMRSGGDVRAMWDALSVDRRRVVLDGLFERIVVHGNGSPWYAERLRESLLAEADDAEAAGDNRLAARRRRQADSRTGGGGSFRAERLEPVWREVS